MGMQFTVRVTGTIVVENIDASYVSIDAESALESALGYNGSLTVNYAEVEEATVTISAEVALDDVEVEAADISEFSSDNALEEAMGFADGRVRNSDFEVTDSPTGFDEVTAALGYDAEQAYLVYAALDAAGFEVN